MKYNVVSTDFVDSSLANQSVLLTIKQIEKEKKRKNIEVLRKTFEEDATYSGTPPTDELLKKLYEVSIQRHQSNNSKNGAWFEKTIHEILEENHIPHEQQVSINHSGIIVRLRKKGEKGETGEKGEKKIHFILLILLLGKILKLVNQSRNT